MTPDRAAIAVRPLQTLQIGLKWFDSGAGGADRFYTDLMRHLPGAGIDVDGIVVGPDDALALSDGLVRGIGCADASLRHRLLAARRMIGRATATKRYDLVGSHFGMLTAVSLDRLRGIPLVVHFHGPWADESAAEGQSRLVVAAKRTLEKRACRRARRVVTMSDAFADHAHVHYGVPRAMIQVVPGSIDTRRFHVTPSKDQARACLGLPLDRPLLVSVRRLARRMGLDNLLTAMPAIVAANPGVLLCIGGKGELADALAAQASSLGLDANVRFLGFVPDCDLPLLYRAADLNLVPTQALEGFGLTAVEALAAGTPSMVTPIGGLPEIMRPLEPALVFRGASPRDIEDGICAFLRGDIALPDRAACQAHAERYATRHIAAEIAAIYRTIVPG